MKQVSMIDTLEAQREYVKAIARGYGFTHQGNFAHYLFTRGQVEPVTRATLPPGEHFIFTFEGCTLASAKGNDVVITPCHKPFDWTLQALTIAADIKRAQNP